MLKKATLLFLGLFPAVILHASDYIVPDELPIQWGSIITLSGGAAFATAGQNQYLYPEPLPSYQYYTHDANNSSMGSVELFFGLQKPIHPYVLGEWGLGIGWVSDAEVSGYATVNGYLNAYSYSYQVNHGRLELKGRLIGNTLQPVQPYISGSLGVGFNNSHHYEPALLNANAPNPLWYVDHTTIALPYSFGVGVQTNISPHWQVAAGYQFADLGKSYLDGDGTVLTKGLILTHFYTNEVIASISYTFS